MHEQHKWPKNGRIVVISPFPCVMRIWQHSTSTSSRRIATSMNFSPEFFGFQVLTEEDRLDGAPQFGERLVGRMLEIVASKAVAYLTISSYWLVIRSHHGYAGCAGCRRGGAAAGVGTFCAQGYRAIRDESWLPWDAAPKISEHFARYLRGI